MTTTLRYLLRHPRRALYQLRTGRPVTGRYVYTPASVALQGPLGNLVSYLDQMSIREVLRGVANGTRLPRALEVGCGYGRVTMVLREVAERVTGVEREAELVELARRLLPDVTIVMQDSILTLPVADASQNLVMTFTVLQHMIDADVRRVIAEILRVTAPDGWVLLGEKIEPLNETARTDDNTTFLSKHRPVERYQEWMHPFRLVAIEPRRVPATGEGQGVGLMLFHHQQGPKDQ